MSDSFMDDWTLFARASEDDDALDRLFKRHRKYIYRLAWGMLNDEHTANDVVQEVFLKIRSGRLRATPRAKFTTWLYKVALNTAREQARLKRKTWGDKDALIALKAQTDHGVGMVHLEALEDLNLALSALPLRQKEVVLLRFLEGFDTGETAEIMGCREGTVKAHLHKATTRLRTLLGDD